EHGAALQVDPARALAREFLDFRVGADREYAAVPHGHRLAHRSLAVAGHDLAVDEDAVGWLRESRQCEYRQQRNDDANHEEFLPQGLCSAPCESGTPFCCCLGCCPPLLARSIRASP